MKKLFFFSLLGIVLLFGCASEDDNNTSNNPPSLEVTVDPFTTNNVTVRWSFSGTGSVVYRILFQGEIVEQAFYGDEYTFEISENGTYNGMIVAVTGNNDEISENFSFSTSGSGIWFGNLTIDTEQKYNDFNYNTVTGDLTITNLGEHDLSNLSSLTSVGGLLIENNQLTSIQGLENLAEIKFTGIYITNNKNLTNICCLDSLQGFNFGAFTIENNEALVSIEQLPILERIINLTLKNNPNLSDLSGFSSLETITDQLYLENVPLLTNLEDFSSLSSIGTLRIMENSITHLIGLNALDYLGYLRIDNNDQLLNVNLANIEQMGGIYINGNELLETIEFSNIHELDGNSFVHLNNNASLTQINLGNPEIANSRFSIRIYDIPNFTTIQGLQTVNVLSSLSLSNLPMLINLNAFSGIEIVEKELRLENLQGLTSLDGLNNLTSAALGDTAGNQTKFYLLELSNITSLSGLDNLESVGWLWISGNSSLTSLDGSSLHSSIPEGGRIHILANPNLSDFCGLTTFVNEGNIISATINSNAYNPTLSQIGSETECSL